jgi:hypothetical protein
MKRFHLFCGLAIMFIFLLTGKYMEWVQNRELSDGPRMLYRSRHIYLLLAGLLNLSIGLYFTYRPRGWRRRMQTIGSVLLILSPSFLLAGFFYEPHRGPNRTVIAPLGIFAVALGTLFHWIGSLRKKNVDGVRH